MSIIITLKIVMKHIYLDYAANTPLDEAITSQLSDGKVGNASSQHWFGRAAQKTVDAARDSAAQWLDADRVEDIVFTSGATESNNMVVWGAVLAARARLRGERLAWPHIVTTTIEHSSVLEPIRYLERQQFCTVTYISPDATGRVQVADVIAAIKPQTCLVSVQYVNNEIGTVQPIWELGEALQQLEHPHVLFHTDAVQAAQFFTCNVKELKVDAMSISSHKVYGPQGVGLLYTSSSQALQPLVLGGGQEFGARSGSVNVAGIEQFGAALQLLSKHKEIYTQHAHQLYTQALALIADQLPQAVINGSPDYYAPHILNLSVPRKSAEELITKLDIAGIAISAGSACHAGAVEPSHVIASLVDPTEQWRVESAVRLSWGKDSTPEEIAAAIVAVAN